MKIPKVRIPKMSNNRKIYVYRAMNADSINTISKVKDMTPVIIIDEAVAIDVNGYYEVEDWNTASQPGITYNGPLPNTLPSTEYSSSIKIVQSNQYTYVNAMHLEALPLNYNGTMIYYSAIGVDETNNLITHLSKVNGILIDNDYKSESVRYIYSCNDYQQKDTDVWEYVNSLPWGQDIIIGDITDKPMLNRFGNPFVPIVQPIDKDKCKISTRPVLNQNMAVLEFQNPWQKNNKHFNYRKLKSYKVQNVSAHQYSEYSTPTYQSLLPVSIEKMIILQKIDPVNIDTIIPLGDTGANVFEIIRKDGIYYNAKTHKTLGFNKYNIPLGETVAVFSEASVQDTINIQVETFAAHRYAYTIYLMDIYGNVSEPTHITLTT